MGERTSAIGNRETGSERLAMCESGTSAYFGGGRADIPLWVCSLCDAHVFEAGLDHRKCGFIRGLNLEKRAIDRSDDQPFSIRIIGERTYELAPDYLYRVVREGEKLVTADLRRDIGQLLKAPAPRACSFEETRIRRPDCPCC